MGDIVDSDIGLSYGLVPACQPGGPERQPMNAGVNVISPVRDYEFEFGYGSSGTVYIVTHRGVGGRADSRHLGSQHLYSIFNYSYILVI